MRGYHLYRSCICLGSYLFVIQIWKWIAVHESISWTRMATLLITLSIEKTPERPSMHIYQYALYPSQTPLYTVISQNTQVRMIEPRTGLSLSS